MKKNLYKFLLTVLGSVASLLLLFGNIDATEITQPSTKINEETEIENPDEKATIQPEVIEDEETLVKDEVQETPVANQPKKVAKSLQKSAYVLSSHEIIVYDANQLKSAIEAANNGITTIYFGANITGISAGALINPTKANITISGTNPLTGVMYNYIEYKSASPDSAIRIKTNPSSQATITLKDIIVVGENYYGSIVIFDYMSNISLLFDNVTYIGPQPVFNRNGNTIIKDSHIIIPSSGHYSTSQEVGEVNSLIIQGDTIIDHYPSSAYPTFNFINANGLFKIDKGAKLTINSNRIFNNGSSNGFNFTIDDNAEFIYNNSVLSGNIITGANGIFQMNTGSKFNAIIDGNSRLINWQNSSGSFNLSSASLNYVATQNITTIPILIGEMNLYNSDLNMETKKDKNVYFISSSNSQTIIDSTIKLTSLGNSSTVNSGINSTGITNIVRSKYSYEAQGRSGNNILQTATLNLINSEVDINLSGLISSSSSSRMVNTTGVLTSNNSKINAKATQESGAFLYAQRLDLINISNFNFYTNSILSGTTTGLSTASTLTIPTGNSIKVHVKNVASTSLVPLSIAGDLNVNSGSTLHVITEAGSHPTLVELTGSNRLLALSNPKSMLLYGGITSATTFRGSSSVAFNISAQQVNAWKNTTGFDNTQLLNNLPNVSFTKANNSNITLTGNTLAQNTNVTTSNYTSEDGPVSPIGTFSFSSAKYRIISIGQAYLTVDQIKQKDLKVSGISESDAAIKVSYKSNNTPEVSQSIADANGNYSINTKAIDLDDVKVISVKDFLYAKQSSTVLPIGELKFISTPISLDFGKVKVPTKTVLVDIINDWNLEIKDDRENTSNWRLYAKVTKSLTPADSTKPTLLNSIVYVDNNNNKQYFEENKPILVAESIEGVTNIKIDWESQKGIILEVNPGNIYSGTQYQGEIQWILSPIAK